MRIRIALAAVIAAAGLVYAPLAVSQPNPKAASRAVNIWSDGTRMSGDLFYPADAKEGDKFPAILLCHGWGGVKEHLRRTYAPRFAAAGFVVLTFDYRGWGESDSRLVMHEPMPKPDADGNVTVKAQAIRELVDPFDQLEDIRNAINFLEGEAMVDTTKIGLWGSSFGGGLVLQTAINDPRVKCVVDQVGAVNARDAAVQPYLNDGGMAGNHAMEIKRSRGEAPAVPQGENVFPNLRGTPHLERFARFAPVDEAHKLKVPILIIDAENEELFSRHEHGEKVYNIVKDNVPAKYHVEPGIQHYGIYQARYVQGADAAIAWYVEHLKGKK
jgi:dienelactone hydrolase